LLFLFYFLSFLGGFRANSWFSLWIFLEINLLALLCLFFIGWLEKIEFLIKYFLIQSIASFFLLGMFFVGGPFYIIFLVKMGAYPFHFWLLRRAYFMSEVMMIVILAAQKFILFFWVFYLFRGREIFILINILFRTFLLTKIRRLKFLFF